MMGERKLIVSKAGAIVVCAMLLVSCASVAVESQAPTLPQPNAELRPAEIVEIVVNALGKNDQPFTNAGIETAFNFASPANRESTGPLDRFVTLVKGPVFGQMIDHRDNTVSQVLIEGDKALCLVQIIDTRNQTFYYAFRLGLQQQGDYAGMWLTEAVWPLHNPDREVLSI